MVFRIFSALDFIDYMLASIVIVTFLYPDQLLPVFKTESWLYRYYNTHQKKLCRILPCWKKVLVSLLRVLGRGSDYLHFQIFTVYMIFWKYSGNDLLFQIKYQLPIIIYANICIHIRRDLFYIWAVVLKEASCKRFEIVYKLMNRQYRTEATIGRQNDALLLSFNGNSLSWHFLYSCYDFVIH